MATSDAQHAPDRLSDEEARSFLADASQVIDVEPGMGAFFAPEFLRRRRFGAALFGGDFRDRDRVISTLCADHAIDSLLCASFDTATIAPAMRITASHEDLSRVREKYHTPSYVISDALRTIVLVSDSDYFWGIAGTHDLVAVVARAYATTLALDDGDVAGFSSGEDPHDQRIGAMLARYLAICRASLPVTARNA